MNRPDVPRPTPPTGSRWRRVLVVGGALTMAYAVVGALTDPDARPVGMLLFLAGVLVAHDVLLLPAVIGLGVLADRHLPPRSRGAVRVLGLATVTLLVVAVPLLVA